MVRHQNFGSFKILVADFLNEKLRTQTECSLRCELKKIKTYSGANFITQTECLLKTELNNFKIKKTHSNGLFTRSDLLCMNFYR